MYKNLLSWLTVLLVLPSCSDTSPNITVVCEENNVGNCIIKWETVPALEGQVKVYASNSPELIPENHPVAMTSITDGKMSIVTNDPSQRYYYLMVFNDKYRIKVATRNVNIPGIQNFRDLGGYKSTDSGKTVRFGMIYRSAQIDSIPRCSRRELKNMGIRTIIDLRSESERQNYPQLNNQEFNIIHIPILAGNMEKILQGIQEEKIKSDTIYRLVERMNRELVSNYRKEYKELFSVLLNRNNYPAVIHCTSGKGRTGVVSALLLAALGVNDEVIMSDYRLSNDYFNIPKASRYAYKLPVNSQEAITTIYSAKEDFLNAAREQIEAEYGSVQGYLKKGIGLSAEEIEQLRSILLE
ncbi:tyrosine-protein phosphatase [uncultured Bacteroides sp.]|uniref:tyrosine-protein phosphatase n=1 Tax=uncultured Bacteroides sp. TaxID=162156 RepID=UPI0025E7F9BA|nr:tyrosine-protein phosphatase [uncultured Bacteroides sp.]